VSPSAQFALQETRKPQGFSGSIAVAAAVVCLSTAQLHAAPAGMATQQNATPAWQWAQGGYSYAGYASACPYGYYYACRYDDPYYGARGHCACWPFLPYWLYH
jgi:hypothetical protein